jgi:hypothetical protein
MAAKHPPELHHNHQRSKATADGWGAIMLSAAKHLHERGRSDTTAKHPSKKVSDYSYMDH